MARVTPLTREQRDRYNATQRVYNAARRAQWKANGLCQRCGHEPVPAGTASCAACRAQQRTAKARRQAAGRCVRCGQPRDVAGVHCAACRDHVRITRRAYLATPQGQAINRNRLRAREAAFVAAGLCRRCGKAPVPAGAWCAACRETQNWRLLKRFATGRCRRCPAPREGRHLECAQCRLLHRVRGREYAARAAARTDWIQHRVTTVSDVRWRYLTGEVR